MQRTPETSPLFQALKVLGEPNRLQILLHVGLECCPVTDIINATGLPQTEGGFVRAERRGPFVYYCLEDPELLHILHELKEWLEARPLLTAETTSRQNPASKHSAQNRVEEVSS
jgi:hypothetical protein